MVCDATGVPAPDMIWSFNNNELDANDGRYQVDGNILKFAVDFQDNGLYKCEAINEAGTASKDIVLVVFIPPAIIPKEDDAKTARFHSEVLLPCKTEGYPNPDISWSYEGQIINSSRSFIYKNGDLVLRNVDPTMAGPYVCEAVNKIGSAQRITFLSVNEPPKIISELEPRVDVNADTSFYLICVAEGSPEPDTFWAKNGEKYTDGSQQQLLDVTFGNITTGNYTCIAQNPEGADTRNVEIFALEPPKFIGTFAFFMNAKINVTEGDNLDVTCPFQNAKNVTWYKDGSRFYGSTEILQLNVATLNDHGNYTCVAENEAGSRNHTQEIIVLAPPRVISNDVIESFGDISQFPEIAVTVGEDLDMDCPTEGYPKPKIQWLKDNIVISSEPELILKNIQPFQAGRYECIATNALGAADYTYILQVLAPPSTHLPKSNWKEGYLDQELDIDCIFLGNPTPKIVWMKDGMPLSENNPILHIEKIQAKDKGTYKCIATNGIGTGEIVYHLNVLESPQFTFASDDMTIEETDDLMLRCAAKGSPLPILTWTYNGQMLLGSSKISQTNKGNEARYGLLELDEVGNPISNGHSNEVAIASKLKQSNNNFYGKVFFDKDSISLMLIVTNTSLKLPGIYTCHAVNALGTEDRHVNVDVLAEPFLQGRDIDRQTFTKLNLLSGLPMILYCPWQGRPIPSIEWFKNNNRLTDDYNLRISHDGQILTIPNSEVSDAGLYTCKAMNTAGYDKKDFQVDILTPPHFRLGSLTKNNLVDMSQRLTYDGPRHIESGEDITLECPVTGNPIPLVFWVEQNLDDNNRTQILQESSTQLILSDIQKSSIYTCYANNTLGFVEKQYQIQVLKTPQIDNFQTQQNVHEHQTITIHCPVKGNPKPEITWYKNGIEIGNPSQNVFFSQDRSVIKITNAKRRDSGIYTCKAFNVAGASERDVNVTVVSPVMWSEWESWSPCSLTCGVGIISRRRRCLLLNGGLATEEDASCLGKNYESQSCEMSPCPINGGWGKWTNWTACSKNCWVSKDKHKPTRKRYRDCNSPSPAMGGKSCVGSDYEEVNCDVPACKIDGGWSNWTPWSPCSVSCGSGFATRYRECNNPVPLQGGQICIGSALESQVCYAGPCPIHGGWSEWTQWSECSQTCGTGAKKRKRTCTSPEPRYGGLFCLGDNVEVTKCRIQKCKNSDLLRSLPHHQRTFKPQAEFESKLIFNQKDAYDQMDLEDPPYEFATGSDPHTTSLYSREDDENTDYEESKHGTHVVVKLENLMPIDKDTTQISFHPGRAPFVLSRVSPCIDGFELDKNSKCVDIDECEKGAVCSESMICANTIGSYVCSCSDGYLFDYETNRCEDIDECIGNAQYECSHNCKNTLGSYMCSCPPGYNLDKDKKTCELVPISRPYDDYEMSDPAAGSLEVNRECSEGYYKKNNLCIDVDECETMEDECGMEQTCLNTNGSYLCIPTSCPPKYTRDNFSGQCVLMCNDNNICPERPKVSQTLSYTLLTLENLRISEPFLKVVNYDINRVALPETKFSFESEHGRDLFRLETLPFRKGIAYIYGSGNVKREKLYNIKVKAYSYDPKTIELLYVTKFVIYLYIM